MSFDENPMENNEPEVINPKEGQFVEVEPIQAASGAPVANVPESTPMYGEPVNSGEAPSFDAPLSGEPPKKNNKKIWIIVAVVLVLLCCCCVVIAIVAITNSTFLEDVYYEFSLLPQFFSALASV